MAKVKTKGGRLPVRAYLLYLLLISFMLTGVTFSRYITSSRGDEGARVVKAGEIRIEENGDFYKPGVLAVRRNFNCGDIFVVVRLIPEVCW